MKTKYSAFYKSVISFLIQIGVSEKRDFQGVSDEEINAFEKRMDFPIPYAVREYFRYFGSKLYHVGERNMTFTLDHIFWATETAVKNGVMTQIKEARPDLGRLLFLGFLEYNGNYCLLHEENVENPHFYSYDSDDTFDPTFFYKSESFTNNLRADLMLMINLELYPSAKNGPNHISLHSVEWSHVYKEFYKDERRKTGADLHRIRKEYYGIHDEIEKKENRVYTVDEFEWAFLDYYKSLGNWLPDYENPYKTRDRWLLESAALSYAQEDHDTKYTAFYNSFKSFIHKITPFSRESFIRSKPEEIALFEQEMGVTFPLAVKEYLAHFGKMEYAYFGEMDFSFSKIREATLHAKQQGAYLQICEERPELNKLMFLQYNATRKCYSLVEEGNSEVPRFYMYSELNSYDEVWLKSWYSFTSHIRLVAFHYFRYYLNDPQRRIHTKPQRQISWQPFYEAVINEKGREGIEEIYWARRSYFNLHDEIEQREGRIYSMDEFEWAFIEHFKSVGYWTPEYTNPFKTMT